jgi:hypothetical protein
VTKFDIYHCVLNLFERSIRDAFPSTESCLPAALLARLDAALPVVAS